VELRVDRDLTQSWFLMQHQADLLQVPVEVYASTHATALGVVVLARMGLEGEGTGLDALVPDPAARYELRMGADEAAGRLDRSRRAAERAVAASDRG
jgi:glycerol kinase